MERQRLAAEKLSATLPLLASVVGIAAVGAHDVEAGRRDVHQDPADELFGAQRHLFELLAPRCGGR